MKYLPGHVAGFRGWFSLVIILCGILGLPGLAAAQALRSQTIALETGWNAVYLEVDPTESDPAQLFAGTPVGVVASHVSARRGAQFVLNPAANLLSTYGWSIWYAPERPDAFLTTLHSVYGGKPYLLFSATNATLEISGSAVPEHLSWTPDAYNFVGFPVVASGGPTFRQFFSASAAHNHNKIYRLVNGAWRQTLIPAEESMRSGEAFWIYCAGKSDYTGPLQVATRSATGVSLSSQGGSKVTFRNRTAYPLSFFVEHLTNPAFPIPISTPLQVLDEETGGLSTRSVHFAADYFRQEFPALEAGQAISWPLALRLQDAGAGERYSLLRVTTEMGTITYIPVTASRDDL